jgi:putative transposase
MLSVWEEEYRAFRERDLSERDYVYVWVDGIHFRIRLEEDRLCALVMIGVRPDGTKELIAIADGYRESQESWSTLLRDLLRRGMRAPVVAVGDGALGFWRALGEVWPQTREQQCWVHRMADVLDKLPKRLQPRAKEALREILKAETRRAAERGMERFGEDYGAKYPKAVESLTRQQDQLLTYFDFPAEHWKHLRTTNPIESTFATVRLRQRTTKGAGSGTRGLVFAYKLLDMASGRWRKLDGSALLPLVRAGVKFTDGVQVERQDTTERKDAA